MTSKKKAKNLPDEFVGYENLLAFIRKRQLYELDGDIVEIGAYMGGGTTKLAKFAKKYGKKVYAIDTFEPSLDQTLSPRGVKACDVYQAFLQDRSMLEVYQKATRGFDNIVTIKEDSRRVKFGKEQKFFFGFVDGCHQRDCVENDFYVVWPNLVSGGALGFHDYEYDDWPEVTMAVDSLLDKQRTEVKEVHEITGIQDISTIILIKK